MKELTGSYETLERVKEANIQRHGDGDLNRYKSQKSHTERTGSKVQDQDFIAGFLLRFYKQKDCDLERIWI